MGPSVSLGAYLGCIKLLQCIVEVGLPLSAQAMKKDSSLEAGSLEIFRKQHIRALARSSQSEIIHRLLLAAAFAHAASGLLCCTPRPELALALAKPMESRKGGLKSPGFVADMERGPAST